MRLSDGPYADAATRWFSDSAGASAARRLIEHGVSEERSAWQAFRAFGLGTILVDERDPQERAAIVAQVSLSAAHALYTGPVLEGEGAAYLGIDVAGTLTIVAIANDTAPASATGAGGTSDAPMRFAHAAASDRLLGVVVRGDVARLVNVGMDRAAGRGKASRLADGSSEAVFALPDIADGAIPQGTPIDANATREWRDLLWLSTAARLVGVSEESLLHSLEYLQTRTQFGRTLSSFQVLQHQTVDRHCDVLMVRALLDRVLVHWANPALRRALLPALKALAAKVALATTKSSVQHFGATGFSHEGDAGLYLRHAMTLAARHGDERTHRRAFARTNIDLLGQV